MTRNDKMLRLLFKACDYVVHSEVDGCLDLIKSGDKSAYDMFLRMLFHSYDSTNNAGKSQILQGLGFVVTSPKHVINSQLDEKFRYVLDSNKIPDCLVITLSDLVFNVRDQLIKLQKID